MFIKNSRTLWMFIKLFTQPISHNLEIIHEPFRKFFAKNTGPIIAWSINLQEITVAKLSANKERSDH